MASSFARCSGDIFASVSAGLGGVPVAELIIVISHSPVFTFSCSAASAANETARAAAIMAVFCMSQVLGRRRRAARAAIVAGFLLWPGLRFGLTARRRGGCDEYPNAATRSSILRPGGRRPSDLPCVRSPGLFLRVVLRSREKAPRLRLLQRGR